MTVLILLLILGGATVAIIFGVRAHQQKLRTDLELLSPEDQRRHAQIVVADKTLKETQKAYDTCVAQALKRLNEARTPRTLASCGPAVLTETSLILNGRARPLAPGMRVDVDASGDVQKYATSRTSATRVVGGALLFGGVGAIVGGGAKKTTVHTQDTRQLFLIVTGPDWQEVVQANPNLGGAARQFAAAVYSSAPHAAELVAEFNARNALEERSYQAIVSGTGLLDAARQARIVLEMDPLIELRAARTQAQLEAKMSAKDAKVLEKASAKGIRAPRRAIDQ